MLTLKDFFHLSPLDSVVEELVADGPGLVVVAGLDPRPMSASAGAKGLLPSGRSTIFGILARQMLTASATARAIVVAGSKDAVRMPRQLKRRTEFALVEAARPYPEQVAQAVRRRPDLLVIDALRPDTAAAALEAAGSGLRVLSQLDTVFRGPGVAQALLELGASRAQLAGLRWVVAVQRLEALCPNCKRPAAATPAQVAELVRRYPGRFEEPATFFHAAGCADCRQTGRRGYVAAFDIFRADGETCPAPDEPNVLPLEQYVLGLALAGDLALSDVLQLEAGQLHRTYRLLTASEHALAEANAALERRVAELEAAQRVLQQRTEALISFQDIGQALITATDLHDLAKRVCRHTHDLCGADRVSLYYFRSRDTAELLAVSGWDVTRVPGHLAADLVLDPRDGTTHEPTPYDRWPPGIPPRPPDVEGVALRAGLRVPLVAQDRPVGVMFAHTTDRTGFAPGDVALLQTFAHQAAVAIQRAGLIEELRDKIVQLQAAQAELIEKERLERELELARQVQQSMLPRSFPDIPGYRFAAQNEPARQVGGDFYDLVEIDAGHFGLVIADVSDKGMPAALYMALTRSLLLAEARRELSPRSVLSSVNQLLLQLGEPNMFVTVFYGVVERATRRLTYARAGHDFPLLLRRDTVRETAGEGTVLGFLEQADLHLSEEELWLESGDRLVLYTDGLTDFVSPDGQPFGRGRLKALLRSHAGLSPEELCATVFASLAGYRGTAEQYDDTAMLVVEVE